MSFLLTQHECLRLTNKLQNKIWQTYCKISKAVLQNINHPKNSALGMVRLVTPIRKRENQTVEDKWKSFEIY